MIEEKRPLKVFPSTSLRAGFSHAHSGDDTVRILYGRLTADGIDAWLDMERLLPDQD